MNKKKIPSNQRGVAIIFVAAIMLVLLGFGSLAFDVGYVFITQRQLQNAADAAALAGANYLYPTDSTGKPNWSLAQTKALAAIQLQKLNNATLADADITMGYWDISGTTTTLKATTITPGATDLAAIMVNVAKSAGKNGGPLQLVFAPAFGVKTANVNARAAAVVGFPSTVSTGGLFPIAMAKTLYDSYWDSSANKPKIDPSTGKPYSFQITTTSDTSGQWTTFNVDANDASTVISFITNGSPTTFNIGDSIWIVPGVKNTVYNSVPSNIDAVVPIVASVSSHGSQKILAFGTIHIDAVSTGSKKYVQVHFNSSQKVSATPSGGTYYGVYTTPRIAR